jgi:HK97 family phage prohead protease
MEKIYRKQFAGTVKDVDTSKGVVTGYFSKFDFKDSDGDILVAGCAKKTIAENGPNGAKRIYHLLQHDIRQVLSEPYLLEERADGIYFESKISQTTIGKDTLILYNDGVYKEHSIGFNIMQEEREQDANVIKEIKLWEGSTVTWGANQMARVTGVKSEEEKIELNEQLERLEKAIKDGSFQDSTFRLLEYELKCIKQSLAPEVPREPTNEEIIDNVLMSFNKNLK